MAILINNRFTGEIPCGPLAGQFIKDLHNNTENSIFPTNSLYGKDWSDAISYLGKKQHGDSTKETSYKMENTKVYLPLEHPLEGRNNPQPSKPFIHWRVPNRYLEEFDEKLLQDLQSNQSHQRSGRQHDFTHTTHFAPPFGKFLPIKSEQQDHMEEIFKRKERIKKRQSNKTAFPVLSSSATFPHVKPQPQEVKCRSANWLSTRKSRKKHDFLERSRRSKVDNLLLQSGDFQSQKAFHEWFKDASLSDRRAAINFFTSVTGKQSKENKEAVAESLSRDFRKNQAQSALSILQNIRPQASPPDPKVLLSLEQNVRALEKAAEKKHHRLYTPQLMCERNNLQTWHHRPVYLHRARMNNALSMYALPNAPIPREFRIHPEWKF